ncbi:MAG: hypothetical protein ABUS56_12210 [Acidobacteriota bacterium]
MAERLAVLLVLFWFAGVVSGYAVGLSIYVALGIGVAILAVRLRSAERSA